MTKLNQVIYGSAPTRDLGRYAPLLATNVFDELARAAFGDDYAHLVTSFDELTATRTTLATRAVNVAAVRAQALAAVMGGADPVKQQELIAEAEAQTANVAAADFLMRQAISQVSDSAVQAIDDNWDKLHARTAKLMQSCIDEAGPIYDRLAEASVHSAHDLERAPELASDWASAAAQSKRFVELLKIGEELSGWSDLLRRRGDPNMMGVRLWGYAWLFADYSDAWPEFFASSIEVTTLGVGLEGYAPIATEWWSSDLNLMLQEIVNRDISIELLTPNQLRDRLSEIDSHAQGALEEASPEALAEIERRTFAGATR